MDNGRVAIFVEDDGTFTMWRSSDRKWLLYPSAGTGYLSVNVDGNVYDNGPSGNLTVTKPLSRIDQESISVAYRAGLDIEVLQIFKMEGDAVALSVSVLNNGTATHDVQIRYLLDTQINNNDGSPLYAPSVGTRVYETDIPAVNFSTWEAWLTPEAPLMRGVGTLSNVPQRMVFAWWPDAEGYPWDYTPDPDQRFYTPGYDYSPYSDSCVLLYFDFGAIPSSYTAGPIVTYYGIGRPEAGFPSDQLKEALTLLHNAVSAYVTGTAKLYGATVAPGYKELIEDLPTKNLAWDLTKELAKELLTSGDISGIVGRLSHKGVIKGSEYAAKLLLENLVETGVVKIFPGVTAQLLESLNRDWDIEKIEEHIVNQLWGLQGWKFEDDISGIGSLLDYLHQQFVSALGSIGEMLPEGYPLEETLATIRTLTDAIKAATSFNREPVSEKRIYWQLPGLCDLILSPFNPFVVGMSSDAAKFYKAVLATYRARETIDDFRTYTCMAWTIGGGGVKIVALLTGPGEVPVEAVYWSGIGACRVAGTTMTLLELGTKLALLVELWDVAGKFASDLIAVKDFYTTLLENLVLSLNQYDRISCSNDIDVQYVDIPDVSIDAWNAIAFGTVTVRLSNQDNTKPASAVVLLEILKKTKPLWIFGSSFYTINPGSSRNIWIDFAVPNTAVFLTDRYNAVFRIVTSGGVFTKTSSFTVCSPISCFVDDTIEIIADRLEQGWSAITNVVTEARDQVVDFILSFPGSDFDLHVYDEEGNHVGMNYETGEPEIHIPGAVYSGASGNPEIISVQSPEPQQFQVKVIAVQAYGRESFSVSMIQKRKRNGTLSILPPNINIRARVPSMVFTQMLLAEIGEQDEVSNITALPSDLLGPGGSNISSTNVTVELISTAIRPGESMPCTVGINIPSSVSEGEYVGEIRFMSSANSVVVPILINVTREAVPGDLDGDGDVDYDDYLIFRTCYGSCTGDANYRAEADLDGDGCVTINDYRILRSLISS